MRRYMIHPFVIIIHEVTVLNGVLAIPELDDRFLYNHSSDPRSNCERLLGSTPATQRYIKDISVASKPRKSVTLVRVVFIDTLVIHELDDRFLYNHCSDPRSNCERLLGSTPATQRYNGCLCPVRTRKSLTLVRVVFIDTLAIPELDD